MADESPSAPSADESARTLHIAAGFTAFTGPIPLPELFHEYKEVQADFPERIMVMAEREQAHAHARENEEMALVRLQLTEQNDITKRASTNGAAIIVLFLAASTFLIYQGHDLAGGLLGGVDLVALISVYLGRTPQPKADNVPTREPSPPR